MTETIVMVKTIQDMLAITNQSLKDEFPPPKSIALDQLAAGEFLPSPGPASMNRGDIAAALNALMLVNETPGFKRGVEAAAVACRLVRR
jgi:hypothetical protein